MSTQTTNPFHLFTERNGQPLEAGYIFVGTVDLNPETSPVQVFWDNALTIPAAQPIRTLGGYPSRNGTPAVIYIAESDYSITIRDRNQALVFTRLQTTSLSKLQEDLANNTDPTKGSAMVGHRRADGSATTVRQELIDHAADIDQLETDLAALSDDLDLRFESILNGESQLLKVRKNVNTSLYGVSPINILGDSISHGAFALNLFTNGWVNIFKRMTNAEYDISGNGGLGDSSSYGWAPWSLIGAGPTLSEEIHTSASITGWTAIIGAAAANSIAGIWYRSSAAGSLIDEVVPTFQASVRLFYVQQPGGGTFEIYRVSPALVETLITTVDTNGALDYFATVDFPMTDNGRGSFRYRIRSTTAGQIDINAGASYIANVERSVVNNFSQSGRRLAETSETIIEESIRGAQMFICALSHNDAADGESSPAYFATYKQRIDWIIQYANQYQVPVVFVDFCWSQPASNKVRTELRRVIPECNGIVVNFPGNFRIDGASPSTVELTTTLALFEDAAHPNVRGHQIIAETMAKALNLSVSSKREALEQFDWWMPLALDGGASVINTDTGHRLVSAVKRSGAGIMVRVRIREAAGANPFPTGIRNIQASWPVKYDLAAQSVQTTSAGIEYNLTTGALVSQCNVTPGGQVRINQIATNNQDIIGNLTGPAY